MVQIDDAGSGSLIGGTCIGVLRIETNEYYYEIIPIELYTEKYIKNKLYLNYVVDIVKKSFDILGVIKSEPIQVCRGYMFEKLKKWLLEENYIFNSTVITDPLQSLIEKTFEDYAVSLGLPINFIRYTKYPFHFHRILKWVYADYEDRKSLCKTGWKSWSKYGNLNPNISNHFIEKSNYICLKCGEPIPNNSKVKILSYVSNRFTTVYLHDRCI